jgi:hypothetical protein
MAVDRRRATGPMNLYWFLLGALATWRLTHLVVAEDGPWQVFARLRRAAEHQLWKELLDCFYCLSLWIAAPLALLIGDSLLERALMWPALSGAAILLERATDRSRDAPALYVEDEESRDDLLR